MKFGEYDIDWIVSPEEMEDRDKFNIYKYVIFGNGKTLFCDIRHSHSDIVDELHYFGFDYGKPVSAGRIVVDLWNGKQWNHVDIGSVTLRLRGSWEEDFKVLQPLMQKFTLNESLHS